MTQIWLAQNPDCGRTVVGIAIDGKGFLASPSDAARVGLYMLAAAGQAFYASRVLGYRAPEQKVGWLPRLVASLSDQIPIQKDETA